MSAPTKGMLSKQAARKSLIGTLIDLYKGDLAFRGMTDFAVIGFVTMMFLHPPAAIQLPTWDIWRPAPTPTPGPTPTPLPPAAAAVPIQFPPNIKNARFSDPFIFDIDKSVFQSSSSDDQKRLAEAWVAIALDQSDKALAALKGASDADPNVALLRGAAEAGRRTQAGYKAAQTYWRQAVNGGSVQAKALLGQLIGTGLTGAASNPTEAAQLIDAGVDLGDRQAMRIAGIGYLSGELGKLDPTRAADLLKRSADAGDPMAMALYARMLSDDLGVAKADRDLAAAYLEKAANAGLTMAQFTLGQWIFDQFSKGVRADPKEGIAWMERAYEKGRSLTGLTGLAAFLDGTPGAWSNKKLAADYVRRCSALPYCQVYVGYEWKEGNFGKVDLLAARAHTAVSTRFNPNGIAQLNEIDAKLSPAQRAEAATLEQKLLEGMSPEPPELHIQFAELPPIPRLEAIWPSIPPIAGVSSSTPQPDKSAVGPSDLQSLFDQGEAAFYKGDYRAAIAAMDKYIDAAQSADDKSKAIGYYARARSSLQLAIAEGDTCKAMLPPPPSCSSATKFEPAARDLDKSLTLDPNQAEANFLFGLIADKTGDQRKAIDYYTYALRANRDYGAAYNNRGVLYANLGQNDLAMADYNEAIRSDPQNAWAWANRGVLFTYYRNKKQAISDLRHALEIAPDLAYARDNLRKLGVRR
ncbi:tetratricopeptide repeat protein [Hyphomicrobium sp. NDB2Meth4]|uniref:tetratricopeptide repeat protein n=1 Tax=Hyphomicrobium sp. NDB2Meth4 TaxID=1892846 RepID=UPI000931B924|nr:tetratricopeptide repeat protein [Hyphomicrobium sp. NDB2Meth4]